MVEEELYKLIEREPGKIEIGWLIHGDARRAGFRPELPVL
jgi:hypothetical protein